MAAAQERIYGICRGQVGKIPDGRLTDRPGAGPVVISSEPGLLPEGELRALDFKDLVLRHLFD